MEKKRKVKACTVKFFLVITLIMAVPGWAETELPPGIQKLLSGLPEKDQVVVRATPIQDLYEIIAGAEVFYVTADGRYLIRGDLSDLQQRRSLTAETVNGIRRKLLSRVEQKDLISFATPDEKYQVWVFTDIDCGYCRKMHSEIERYLTLGISIDYIAYPRAGIGSPSFDKAVNVWCADNRPEAMTRAKQGKKVVSESCDNPVAEQFRLGGKLGIRGTPTLVLPDGSFVPGYLPAEELLERLESF